MEGTASKPVVARPNVSICMPVYNASRWIDDAVASVWAQRYQDFEIVIVDDASTDGTYEKLLQLTDPRLRLYRNARNLGQSATTSRAVELARGEWVKFLHADDMLHADCLARMMDAVAAAPQVGMVFGRRRPKLDDDSDSRSRKWVEVYGGGHPRLRTLRPVNSGRAIVAEWVRDGATQNWIGEPSGVMVRRDLLASVGGMNRRMRLNVDAEWWARILHRTHVAFIDDPVFTYRVHSASVTGTMVASEGDWLDRVWMFEGLRQDDDLWSAAPRLQSLRRRAVARAAAFVTRRLSQRDKLARHHLADWRAYGRYRLQALTGRSQPVHDPIALMPDCAA